jgi:signal transduction histidine kinase
MITEQADFYALIDNEWTFYGHGRISTLMRKTGKAWKIVYEHGSLPDSKAGEGEQINTERIKAENLQLRDAVKRRTIELEHKNWELKIEAALERVRAVAMSMRKPDELSGIGETVFRELQALGFADLRNTEILINNDAKESILSYYYSDYGVSGAIEVFYNDHPVVKNWAQEMKKASDAFAEVVISDSEIEAWRKYREEIGYLPDPKLNAAKSVWYYSYSTGLGALSVSSFTPITEEQLKVLGRFRNVFGLAYRRYVDVALAVAQAREAQIEAALERVRTQTMTMHNSEDVGKCTVKMFGELTVLGVGEDTRFGIGILNHDNENNQLWTASKDGEEVKMHIGNLDMTLHPLLKSARKAWKEQVLLHKYVLEGEDLLNYYQMLNNAPDYKFRIAIEKLPEREFHYGFIFDQGFFYAFSPHEFQPDLIHIIQRFSSLFGQTYRRYLDLVKAEAQAREAQIEAALERVRARSIAMRHSDELSEAAELLYQEFLKFGVESFSCGYLINDDEKGEWKVWLTNPGEPFFKEFWTIPYKADHNLEARYESWKRKEAFHCAVLEGEENRAHHVVISQYAPWKAEMLDSLPPRLVFNSAHFSLGHLFVISPERLAPELEQAMVRFAGVFDLAYRRFLDLQKAEARAREAEQQASLDRVRAEIASMRTAGDLQRITPLIWRELTTLGVPFFRCGVFIIDEATEHAHVYLSSPSGEAVAALHLKFDSAPVIAATVQHWRQQQVYREEWNREQFIAWTQSILKQRLIDSSEEYQAGGEAPEKLVLQFMPFAQGMLYIGSRAALLTDEIAIGQALAKAFGVAYARYEDFQRLEAAKAQVEAALENLKKTQQQLVTQEKLASLGQLTAGIAHEIKNPLNFVNNFAALSVDLAKELREEIGKQRAEGEGPGAKSKDDFANIEEIIDTLIQNAEKINHHGKRADNIVKSMMQHARGSSGQRELVDINHLLDEAVNLTYHGMRANDASFNITIEKDYDESIGKIEIVPQDISRVFLNIINNACYAAQQKKKMNPDGFSPTLSVSSKNLSEKIEIRIRDNGNGIPVDIREKIFNPFFTTKPTGQGTGLGLSISYDIIVQEHRGEVKVETEKGKFTEFVVRLPRMQKSV